MISKFYFYGFTILVLFLLSSCAAKQNNVAVMKTNQAKGAASDEILTKEELEELASVFDDEPFTGGQIAPRISKWVNNNTFIFLQFDKARPENATKIRYIGIGVRGTFCQSSQPNPDFTHFHRPNIANYSQGHGGKPGEAGYWLMWVAVDVFDSQGRRITPGVDELFSPTPAPDC